MAGSSFVVGVQGLSKLDLTDASPKLRMNTVRALNKVSATIRTRGSRLIRESYNFPASYLSPSSGNLIVLNANTQTLTSVIRARQRATQMSRFKIRGTVGGRDGVTVSIKTGATEYLRRGFVLKLNNGNEGVALHMRQGETLRNKRNKQYGWISRKQKNKTPIYVLDTVSVDQAFGSLRGQLGTEAARLFQIEIERLGDIFKK